MTITSSALVSTLMSGALLLVACAVGTEAEPERLGSPAAHERIAGLSDCGELQDEFDVANANFDGAAAGSDAASVAISFMEHADERLIELGCYE